MKSRSTDCKDTLKRRLEEILLFDLLFLSVFYPALNFKHGDGLNAGKQWTAVTHDD